MHKVAQRIFHRGATYYVRLRIPAALRSVYPPEKSQITLALAATDELGLELTSQRADLARLLSQGRSQPILGVLHNFRASNRSSRSSSDTEDEGRNRSSLAGRGGHAGH